MAGTKISALPAGIVPVAADLFPSVQSAVTVKVTASQVRQYVGEGLGNSSSTTVSGAYAADTYLAGSAIAAPAGIWQVGTVARWVFDITKTAAGTASFTIQPRLGTAGTTADASLGSIAFAAGTAAVDTGIFEVWFVFHAIGATANGQVVARCTHHLAATGLISTGAAGVGILTAVSGNVSSTAATILGLSINGGASFSGTNTFVTAGADKL